MSSSTCFVAAPGSVPCGGLQRGALGPPAEWRDSGLALRTSLLPAVSSSRLPRPARLHDSGVVVMAVGKKGRGGAAGGSRKKNRPAARGAAAAATPKAAAAAAPPAPKTEKTTIADYNPGVPRTAEDIAAAYTKKMAEKPKETRTWLERIYFISPFASQTGERPPWYLNPNITFVLVFIVVGVAFYAVVASGGVHQGYVNGAPPDVNPFTK